MTEPEPKKKVLVAMSGGVDSSVAAALLVEQGFEVIGVTMQVWDYSSCEIEEGNGTCCSSIDVDDARAVADKLGIPFYVLNCEEQFKTAVITPFIDSYLQGETPLPCVNCNTFLKFDHLFRKMHELGCDYLATGHYARIVAGTNAKPAIETSTDGWKDQTYFLFTLKPELIPYLLFPVGHLKKAEVRDMAERQGLVVARKKDSTGICFIGKQGYGEFIGQYAGSESCKKGPVKMYPTGEVVAEHEGIHNFTYGQRKRLGVFRENPLYVVKIEAATNTVWVGEQEHLFSLTARIEEVNWLDEVRDGEEFRVKIRYHHPGSKAKIRKQDNSIELQFVEPQRSITPGQAAVFYRDRQLVGGGWIV